MITAKAITEAWVYMRTTNNSIPDEVLDFMKEASLEKLNHDHEFDADKIQNEWFNKIGNF